MTEKYAVVITTINRPTRAVVEIARDAPKLDAHFVLIGDEKSPADFAQQGAEYLDIAAQRASGFAFARIAPTRHYARKNIGYLAAIRAGATILVETDDDNIPLPEFWSPRALDQTGAVLRDTGWVNVYRYFSSTFIWPRGLPLENVQDQGPSVDVLERRTLACPIQQGLADQNPDVDAIYRLLLPLPVDFDVRDPVLLSRGAWCPFNSQNTTWWPQAFPLLYLPTYCSFRMTDIWRSFVAQRICWANDWGISFHKSTVFQERNEHNLLRDFEEEIPGYLNNAKIRTTLEALDLPAGQDRIPENVRACFRALVELGVVGQGELELLDAWLADLAGLR